MNKLISLIIPTLVLVSACAEPETCDFDTTQPYRASLTPTEGPCKATESIYALYNPDGDGCAEEIQKTANSDSCGIKVSGLCDDKAKGTSSSIVMNVSCADGGATCTGTTTVSVKATDGREVLCVFDVEMHRL